MKGFSDDILDQADKLTAASKSLDYKRIVAHDNGEVEKLNTVLHKLKIKPVHPQEALDNYADKNPAAGGGGEGSDSAAERQQLLTDTLSQEGFADRINKVYNSFSKDRTTEIDRVPHQRGLPPYDLVLAPDFAPVAGLHGIFITGNLIMSIILTADKQPAGDWHIIKKKSFTSMEEMAELVTLVAAGFDLP